MKTKPSQLKAGKKFYFKNKIELDKKNNIRNKLLRMYGWKYCEEHFINLNEMIKIQMK